MTYTGDWWFTEIGLENGKSGTFIGQWNVHKLIKTTLTKYCHTVLWVPDPKCRFLTKMSIFHENVDFWQKFRYLTKIWIFWPKCRFLIKNVDLWPKFRCLDQNVHFYENFHFWANICRFWSSVLTDIFILITGFHITWT